jgi:hypothetical protein
MAANNVPRLVMRKNIWETFPEVSVKPLGRGANGADRHGVEWHNQRLRAYSQTHRVTEAEAKRQIIPRVERALRASSSWTVEPALPGSDYIFILATAFKKPETRKANNLRNGNQTRKANNRPMVRRWNREPNTRNARANQARNNATKRKSSPSPPSPVAAAPAAAPAPPANNGTRVNVELSGDELIRKVRSIVNKFSDRTLEKLSNDLAAIVPKTEADFSAMIRTILDLTVSNTAFKSQGFHPYTIYAIHKMNAKHQTRPYPVLPSDAIVAEFMGRMGDKLYVDPEVSDSMGNNIINANKKDYYSRLLFLGYLYREGFLPWAALQSVLSHLQTAAMDLDAEMHDVRVRGFLSVLIRAGKRMVAEGGEPTKALHAYLDTIRTLKETTTMSGVRIACTEFLESMENNFTIGAGVREWVLGAPMHNIQVKPKAKTPEAVAKPKQEKLGSDISELWRRFPLDVKQEQGLYVVRFHNKKLAERFQRESARFKTQYDLQTAMGSHILSILDHSDHWKRGPVIAGTLVTIVPK